MDAKRTLHCWEDGPYKADPDDPMHAAPIGSTCMLERDHDGPHEFTPDDEIGVQLKGPRKNG